LIFDTIVIVFFTAMFFPSLGKIIVGIRELGMTPILGGDGSGWDCVVNISLPLFLGPVASSMEDNLVTRVGGEEGGHQFPRPHKCHWGIDYDCFVQEFWIISIQILQQTNKCLERCHTVYFVKYFGVSCPSQSKMATYCWCFVESRSW